MSMGDHHEMSSQVGFTARLITRRGVHMSETQPTAADNACQNQWWPAVEEPRVCCLIAHFASQLDFLRDKFMIPGLFGSSL